MDTNTLHRLYPMATQTQIDTYLPILNRLMPEYGIVSRRQQAHFLAQIAVESGELDAVEENLRYSAVRLLKVFPRYFKNISEANKYDRKPEMIANRVYANRIGNGPEASGDGYRFRGRGLIQITGRANYIAYFDHLKKLVVSGSDALNADLVTRTLLTDLGRYDQSTETNILSELADLLTTPEHAVRSACWFWQTHDLNRLAENTADEATVTAITRRINGGTNGLIDRKKYYYSAKAIL